MVHEVGPQSYCCFRSTLTNSILTNSILTKDGSLFLALLLTFKKYIFASSKTMHSTFLLLKYNHYLPESFLLTALPLKNKCKAICKPPLFPNFC